MTLLKRKEAADRLNISLAKLDADRLHGAPHPPFITLGRGRGAAVRYPLEELEKWITDNMKVNK